MKRFKVKKVAGCWCVVDSMTGNVFHTFNEFESGKAAAKKMAASLNK